MRSNGRPERLWRDLRGSLWLILYLRSRITGTDSDGDFIVAHGEPLRDAMLANDFKSSTQCIIDMRRRLRGRRIILAMPGERGRGFRYKLRCDGLHALGLEVCNRGA